MTTFNGNTVTLAGKKLQVGDTAPDFSLTDTDLSKKTLADFAGQKKVISVVPSIDTGVCDAQTRRFNQELSDADNTVVITVSVDLPFAQARWCSAAGLNDAITLSDYYDYSFGKAYGLLINELHLLGRAVFVLDENNKITYLEYLDEITNHPNYDAALAVAK
ncbi:thiol peroxidase [Streptococcus mutans]|uniref:thiol peroxidase n=1 Tax=Streptococcus mutans TaxID=1309 RepID=UPI0002B53EE6|nr:thiol peroxidase [Streptococcus mutans]EMC40694.1 thiol peroxidase [Streptococcus mutans 66-2A]